MAAVAPNRQGLTSGNTRRFLTYDELKWLRLCGLVALRPASSSADAPSTALSSTTVTGENVHMSLWTRFTPVNHSRAARTRRVGLRFAST